jgi:hypothetical protein
MSRKVAMQGPGGRVVNFYHSKSYQVAMDEVERDRDRLFQIVRRAWASPSTEEAARRIGATAHLSGMTFDEVLYFLYEYVCHRGSGSIAAWNTTRAGTSSY